MKIPFNLSFYIITLGLLARSAFAVDTLPVSGLDATSIAKVGSAENMPAGRFGLGFGIHSANQVIGSDESTGEANLVNRSTQARAIFSYATADWLELSLGIGMTREEGQLGAYAGLLSDDEQSSSAKTAKESDFAGALVAAKIGLIKDGMFKLALSPFFETGSGSDSDLSLTRSSNAKAGWLVMSTFGDQGFAKVDVNLGYRYRKPERIGDELLRNEFLYQGLVRGSISRNLGVFAGGQGRMIAVSQDDDRDESGKRNYRQMENGELTGGLSVAIDAVRLDIYAGKSPQSRSIGHGKNLVGMNLSMTLGEKRRPSLADDVRPAATPKVTKTPDNDDHLVKPAQLEPIKPDDFDLFTDVDKMLANEVDGSTGSHDFKPLPQKGTLPAPTERPAGEELDRVERELNEIKAAEAKIEEEAAKRQAIEDEMNRKERRKEFDERNRLEDSYRNEMRERIEVFPSVTDEDYGWQGLEQ